MKVYSHPPLLKVRNRVGQGLAFCQRCGLKGDLCFCAELPTLHLRTRLSLVVHREELKRPSNTGTLALQCLPNSHLVVRGGGPNDRNPLDLSSLLSDPNYEPVLLFPSPGALVLNHHLAEKLKRPVHLIVPDGNWSQARKLHSRHPELSRIPRWMVERQSSATYFLRKEARENGMSTLEAIALALGFIEGPRTQDELLRVYQRKLHQTLKARGLRVESELL